MAEAVKTCWRWVLASPRYRERRMLKAKARMPDGALDPRPLGILLLEVCCLLTLTCRLNRQVLGLGVEDQFARPRLVPCTFGTCWAGPTLRPPKLDLNGRLAIGAALRLPRAADVPLGADHQASLPNRRGTHSYHTACLPGLAIEHRGAPDKSAPPGTPSGWTGGIPPSHRSCPPACSPGSRFRSAKA